ncbi:MAG: TIR domain-containing protein [Ruminiclostridium sp.]|nr:TIR domain-containing protein [Ruminiclostridium sp.]
MAVFRCKMCGGDLDVTDTSTNIFTCKYCNTQQTIPTLDSEKKVNLFSRANRLRMNNEFDKAAGIYETIASEFIEEAEAYWGLCLCKYGIEYVDDPVTAKKIPTCHRTSYQSIFEDENFTTALQYSDAEATAVYRREAKEIDRLQKEIISIANNEEPFDIFICYKETDKEGERTKDSVLAQEIYDALTEKGYKVFFSRITLEDKLGKEYEPYIFAALSSAKVMLAIGTNYEYFNAVWVKNEWMRFLEMMKEDKSKTLIPCYADIDAYDMPSEFKNFQGQDMSKIGFKQDLVRGIGKLMGGEKPAAVAYQTAAPTLDKCISNAEVYMNLKNYPAAYETYQTMTREYPGNYLGWWGLILASSRNLTTVSEEEEAKVKEWYGYALSLADDGQKEEIKSRMKEYLRIKSNAYADGSRDMYSEKLAKANGIIKNAESAIHKEEKRVADTVKSYNNNISRLTSDINENRSATRKYGILKKRIRRAKVTKFIFALGIITLIACFFIAISTPKSENPELNDILSVVSAIALLVTLVMALVHAISSSLVNSFRRKNPEIVAYSPAMCKSSILNLENMITNNAATLERYKKQLAELTNSENKAIAEAKRRIELTEGAIKDIEAIKDDRENIALYDFYLSCKEYGCDTPTPNEAFTPVWDKAMAAIRLIDSN